MIPTKADQEGPAGKAWRVKMPDPGTRPLADHDGTVDCWILFVPGAHPAWSGYALVVVHLRPIEGQSKGPTIRKPGASHELIIGALDPGCPFPTLEGLAAGTESLRWLEPIDLIEQFTVRSDAEAAQHAEFCVFLIVEGRMSPDQDYRAHWRRWIEASARNLSAGIAPRPT